MRAETLPDCVGYQTGCMDRLQVVNEGTVTVFAGAETPTVGTRERKDPAQLEALRAMGYIE